MWKMRAGVVCSELGRESVPVTEASRPWEGMSASFKGEGRQPVRVCPSVSLCHLSWGTAGNITAGHSLPS